MANIVNIIVYRNIENVLLSLRENVATDTVLIIVRRENVVPDALRAVKRKSFCVENSVTVSCIII